MRFNWPVVRILCVVLSAGTSAALWTLPSRGESLPGDIREQLVGRWVLVSLTTRVGTTTVSQGKRTVTTKDVQPYGPKPQGVLVFERDGRFVSTVANPDASQSASNDPDRPVEFERSSGAFSIHPSRPQSVMLDIEPKSQRYIEITTLTARELAFSTIPWPGGTTYSLFVYARAQ